METIREYALRLLEECNCPLDTYKTRKAHYNRTPSSVEECEADLVTYWTSTLAPKGEHYPYSVREIAEVLCIIGNEQPDPPRRGHKQYCVVYDCDWGSDGTEFDTLEDALADVADTYIQWQMEEMSNWRVEYDKNGCPRLFPTKEQAESWDSMYWNNSCYITEWNNELEDGWGNSGDYCDCENAIYLTDKELEEIGWTEFKDLANMFECTVIE